MCNCLKMRSKFPREPKRRSFFQIIKFYYPLTKKNHPSPPPPTSNFCSGHPITLKFFMDVTYDKIFTHAKIWIDDVIFDDDVGILIFDVSDWFSQYFWRQYFKF